MSSDADARLEMRGFNVPFNEPPEPNRLGGYPGFLNALDIEGDYADETAFACIFVYREILMMRVIEAITDKPEWDRKIFDEAITSKWRIEIAESGMDISPRMMDWIIEELKWRAETYTAKGFVEAFDCGVMKSDTAISRELQQALREAVLPFEDIPEDRKDYHPGSDKKVIDLLHPSLFPVVFGRTSVLPNKLIGLEDCLGSVGEGVTLPVPSQISTGIGSIRVYSSQFQWLPCDVELTQGNGCRILSYINNAHPVNHRALYEVVEKIIGCTIPLWEKSLKEDHRLHGTRIPYKKVEFDDHPDPEPTRQEGEDEDEYWDRWRIWEAATPITLPEPGVFKPPQIQNYLSGHQEVNLREDFDGKLQFIVKLANIELTPEKPNYGGGSWHIEGQLNERICASAIYYYDNDNITESLLSFRTRARMDDDINYPQEQHEFLQQVYGFGPDVDGRNDCHLTQELGGVVCKEGRLITFPNTLQHRVAPFSLADKSRPGHRKILAIFLVDPHRRIISSANVPPQREDWGEEKRSLVKKVLSHRLPPELQDMISCDSFDSLMSMDEAKRHRLALMEERSIQSQESNEAFEIGAFSLCEH